MTEVATPSAGSGARDPRAAQARLRRDAGPRRGAALALFYGLRLAGAHQLLALVLGAVTPLVRIAVTAVRARRLEKLGAFTRRVLAAGTAIGLLTADPRLLLARESDLTGLVGLWT
jgi:hypothetical protein